MLGVRTSPLHQPGTGDAGGMNVYIVELAKRLAAIDIEVEIFTRATSAALPPGVELARGVLVRHVAAGPYEGLAKEDLPAQLCAFTHGVTQAWADHHPGHYDVVHSHYWLSGQTPEPAHRVLGETQVARAADRLTANTDKEAAELLHHYDADTDRVPVVHPGVNLERFRPDASGVAPGRAAARTRLGLPAHALIPLFAGRIQPLKAPDVLLRVVARLLAERPHLRERIVVPVVGGPSGSGLAKPESVQKLAACLGISDVVLFRPPVGQDQLADWYRAASVLVMPSYSDSFGLVAVEAQACGTPVIAAEVGGHCAASPTILRSPPDWVRPPPATPAPSAGTRPRRRRRRCIRRPCARAVRPFEGPSRTPQPSPASPTSTRRRYRRP